MRVSSHHLKATEYMESSRTYTLREQKAAQQWMQSKHAVLEQMVREKWSRYYIQECLYTIIGNRAITALLRARFDAESVFTADINDISAIKGLSTRGIFEIRVARLIFQRIMELYGDDLYGNVSRIISQKMIELHGVSLCGEDE